MSTLDFDDVKPAIIVAITVLNLALNSLVIAVIVKHPQLREDRTTLFMLSLALSDLANGCTTTPIGAVVCSRTFPTVRDNCRHLPRIQAFCSAWFSLVSTNSLSWVTVTKMVAITRPLRCDQTLHERRCYYVITGIWVSGAVMASGYCARISSWDMDTCFYGWPETSTLPVDTAAVLTLCIAFGLLLPLVLIVYSTVRIFSVIKRTHQQIAALSNSIGGRDVFGRTIPSLTSLALRSGSNVLIICLAYVILTIPIAIHTTALVLGMKSRLPASFQFFAIWTIFSNTFVNSLLYLFLFQNVRSKMFRMFKDCCKWFDIM